MGVIFLFIDGVGLGGDKNSNPFTHQEYRGFSAMAGDQSFTKNAEALTKKSHVFKHIDARLGIEGLPQSGTGQAALFSGENAPEKIGKHFGPFPHSGIKSLLKERSLFTKVQQLGKNCNFINAYPDIFFQKAQKRNRWTCTTLMTKSADIDLNTTEEVKEGKALTAEITQQAWRNQLGIDVPQISPEEAADRLLGQAENYDLLLHEYYLTDKAGHSQDAENATRFLEIYDRFLRQLIDQTDKKTTIVLSSDHGNVEDLSRKTHTFNDVPLFAWGAGATNFIDVQNITDITPAIVRTLEQIN